MELKPVVVDDLHKKEIFQVPVTSKKCSESDSLALEDDISRIALTGKIDVGKLVTGCVVAVRGVLTDLGQIDVQEYILPGYPMPKALPASSEKKYIAFISGLCIGDTFSPGLLLLRDLFLGILGNEQQKQAFSRVARLVICGNTLVLGSDESSKRKTMMEADMLLTQLASVLPVDVMTGETDPGHFSMPQPPLHPSMFPNASQLKSFRCCPNPYNFKSGETNILGHSGRPLDNAWAFSTTEKKLDVLEMTLEARHMAPTAPDTLTCNPMSDDCFVMDGDTFEAPHIYFSGNSESKEVEYKKAPNGTLCLMIPKFARQHDSKVVLVESSSLEVEVVNVNASISSFILVVNYFERGRFHLIRVQYLYVGMLKLRPSEIGFCHDTIYVNFGDGRSVSDTLQKCVNGSVNPHNITTISVVRAIAGRAYKYYVTEGNRRLWMFRRLEAMGKLSTIECHEASTLPKSKWTSTNDGRSIAFRSIKDHKKARSQGLVKSNFECSGCNKVFGSQAALDNHFKDVHQVCCIKCGQGFPSQQLLDLHFNSVHQCPACNRTFTTAEGRQKHFEAVHMVSCGRCSKRFNNTEDLDRHCKAVHEFPCHACDKMFYDAQSRKQHFEAVHMFSCGRCNKKFTTMEGRDSHVKAVHEFECFSCGRIFGDEDARRKHYEAVHMVSCGECGKKFHDVEDRDRHYNAVHRFQCMTCDKVFNTADARDRHFRDKHTFACSHCDKRFSSMQARDNHYNAVHRLTCCNRTFSDHHALTQHCRAVHGY